MNNTNFRQSNPIEYILQCLMNDTQIEKFDIRNALDQWNNLKNKQPVAYALDNGDGRLYDLRIMDNPHNDRYKVVKLYRD